MRTSDGNDLPLAETDLPVAQSHDHMGRPPANTVMEAFRMDLPWIIALIALMVFVVMALAGYFR